MITPVPAPVARSLANAAPTPFWLDQPDAPDPLPALADHVTADLAVVGGGFTGLWTALLARERDPSREVVLGTGVFGRSLLRRIGSYVIPVWDYALMTEPLSAAQLAALGWHGPHGASDMSNQFHYFRLTRDNRMLWGGYDAVYYNGGRIRDEDAQSPATFGKLAGHFFEMFPQLEGVSFTHAWGGVIDTCSRFCAFYGTAYQGRLAYAAGYTGLGVGATRFAAQILLDKLAELDTERVRLTLVRGKPLPLPPEPARSAVIQLTRSSIARADRNEGRRDLWLRLLDRVGLGFDS